MPASRALRVSVVFGTRPEAIKLAPVVAALAEHKRFSVSVVLTGQHREMVDAIIGPLGISPDLDLKLMRPGQTLTEIVTASLARLDGIWVERPPDIVVVQGDTSTAFAAALAAFHRRIAVAHIEAGLRSFDPGNPYPEETNWIRHSETDPPWRCESDPPRAAAIQPILQGRSPRV